MMNPTRMNLINTRKGIARARKGYGILKKKREVLVLEFMKLVQQSTKDRSYLNQLVEQGYRAVGMASTYVGNFELEGVAMHMKEAKPVGMNIKNIMGVRVPEITRSSEGDLGLSYSLLSTNVAVDDIRNSFVSVINTMIDVAQREQGLRRLVMEIDKTKRRVNALDYIVIPRMRGQVKYISMRLDEMDRDTFSALKHIKKKLERKQAS
ncbi:MAG: V-type ATP synthase subunit D [Candidatus Micrarchaeota archaeon]|nr:V-type ATP synthase subunit D [Candidatus Micrarchaeota archaeon]